MLPRLVTLSVLRYFHECDDGLSVPGTCWCITLSFGRNRKASVQINLCKQIETTMHFASVLAIRA